MMWGPGYGYGYGMMGSGWWGGLIMLAFGLAVLVAIALVIVWAVRVSVHREGQGSHGASTARPGGDAADIARRRFASGEITKEQYEEIMRALAG